MDAMPAPTPVSVEQLLAHERRLRALVRSMLRDDQRTDDVLQDTWVVALTRPPRQAAALGAWLTTVARNLALKAMRGDGARGRREEAAASPEAVPSTADIVAREAARREVIEVLLALDEPYRTALVLHFCEGLPPREIAKRLAIPAATARTHLHRGIERLRSAFDAKHGGNRAAWRGALAAAWGIAIGGTAEAGEPAVEPATHTNGGWTMTGTITGIAASLALLLGVGIWLGTAPNDEFGAGADAASAGEHLAGAGGGGDDRGSLPALPAATPTTPGAAAAPDATQPGAVDSADESANRAKRLAPQRVGLAVGEDGSVRLTHSTAPGVHPGGALDRAQVFKLLADASRAASPATKARRNRADRPKAVVPLPYKLEIVRPKGARATEIRLEGHLAGHGADGTRTALEWLARAREGDRPIELMIETGQGITVGDFTEVLELSRVAGISYVSLTASAGTCDHLPMGDPAAEDSEGLYDRDVQDPDVVAEITAPASTLLPCVLVLVQECAKATIARIFIARDGGPLLDVTLPTGVRIRQNMFEIDEHGNEIGPRSEGQKRYLADREAAKAAAARQAGQELPADDEERR